MTTVMAMIITLHLNRLLFSFNVIGSLSKKNKKCVDVSMVQEGREKVKRDEKEYMFIFLNGL